MQTTDVTPRRAQRTEHPSKGDRRERALLDAADRLLTAGRFASASIAEIAEEAGLSRASFYFYFASKQALLASLVDAAIAEFNASILIVADGDDSLEASEAVRSTVRAAAKLWWDHRDVLKASVELGATIPEVYDRTISNFEIVRAPTVALLRRHGNVPEATDPEAATQLVMILMLMSERNFFDLMRGDPTASERDDLTERLSLVWLRAFGLDR